jgi:hypothetical protein
MNTMQKNRWLLDTALFAGFLSCFFLDLTGLSLHQIIGVASVTVAAYHLLSHWNWVSAVTRRFFGKTSDQARLFYALDAALLVGFFTIIATGLVISTWFNLSLTNFTTWLDVHIVASIGTLFVIVLKISLHSRWIMSIWRKYFNAPTSNTRKVLPVAAATGIPRRDFLKVMGTVGIASLFAVISPVQTLQASLSAQETPSSATSTTNGVSNNISSSGSSSDSTNSENDPGLCSVRCGRGCSYPGNCRRYMDSNSNGRCDLGECQT